MERSIYLQTAFVTRKPHALVSAACADVRQRCRQMVTVSAPLIFLAILGGAAQVQASDENSLQYRAVFSENTPICDILAGFYTRHQLAGDGHGVVEDVYSKDLKTEGIVNVINPKNRNLIARNIDIYNNGESHTVTLVDEPISSDDKYFSTSISILKIGDDDSDSRVFPPADDVEMTISNGRAQGTPFTHFRKLPDYSEIIKRIKNGTFDANKEPIPGPGGGRVERVFLYHKRIFILSREPQYGGENASSEKRSYKLLFTLDKNKSTDDVCYISASDILKRSR